MNPFSTLRTSLSGLSLQMVAGLLLLFTLPLTAAAAQIKGLYQAEAPVAGQQAEQRAEAIRAAFGKVLIKVTGNRRITARPELAGKIKNANRYVQQYSYRLAVAASGEHQQEPQRWLQVSFDAAAVDLLLQDLGLPVWSSSRPAMLFWGGIEQQRRRHLLSAEREPQLLDLIERTATGRGLPILFPLLDLEDQGRLQAADLWGDFDSTLRDASARYGADLILAGRMVRVSDKLWRGNWRLFQDQRVVSWANEGSSRAAIAIDGIEQAVDRLAARFAPVVADNSLERTRLRVSGIGSLADYAAVSKLLRSQSGVEGMQLLAVERSGITFQLQMRGGFDALQQGLTLGRLIVADPQIAETSDGQTAAADLYYRMR